jgi:hypothetical protein
MWQLSSVLLLKITATLFRRTLRSRFSCTNLHLLFTTLFCLLNLAIRYSVRKPIVTEQPRKDATNVTRCCALRMFFHTKCPAEMSLSLIGTAHDVASLFVTLETVG